MNAVEIEQAITNLAEQEFDPKNFPYLFLEAFGNKATTINRLKKGSTNSSDIENGVLQRNNIHIAVCPKDEVTNTLLKLKESPTTKKAKAKFILATDGTNFEAEDLITGETVACTYLDFPDHFGFFLSLAGITTVKQIRNNAIDIKATGRLNRLYVELLKYNEDWSTDARRHDMNHFMARLIFCFFAEDTDIFNGKNLFTSTIQKMSDSRSNNTQDVISELFRAMNTPVEKRKKAKLSRWANQFPYVNGGLFSESNEVPKFSRIARSYLLHVGNLDWQKINPDIFGSMIQAVADEEERGKLGMHYTSVPNILKVLNPLFLDDLRDQLKKCGDNARKLINLRKRISNIRVFDPACGSGNFLVIAYKEMRAIEFEINKRRNEDDEKSVIPLTNFRGIELRDFAAEIARLALVIAEYQCDVVYRGQQDAVKDFLPLDAMNWITCGNALKLDWLSICPPTGKAVKHVVEDLFETPQDQAEIDFENEGGETYICGNPPYLGSTWQSDNQKSDLKMIFETRIKSWKSLDYVSGWFMKAADYGTHTNSSSAFVSTNSICQGQQVPIIWPLIFKTDHEIFFAHTSFKWANLASNNAGVTVAIIGLSNHAKKLRRLFSISEAHETIEKKVENINAYLIGGQNIIVNPIPRTPDDRASMVWGNKPTDGGNLILTSSERTHLISKNLEAKQFIRPYYGAAEYIRGLQRYCIWVEDGDVEGATRIPSLKERFEKVREVRAKSKAAETRPAQEYPHRFRQIQSVARNYSLIMPQVSSETREYLPIGMLPQKSIVSNLAFALYDAPMWNMSLIASRLHLVWIATVCGKMKTDFRYSNTMGWNTFPVPKLTDKNKIDLTHCAEEILLAREEHFPATIAELYDSEKMPEDLRRAHDRNDEVLERIYIGRQFKNDTERLEKLFDLYTNSLNFKSAGHTYKQDNK